MIANISTHILTRRMTAKKRYNVSRRHISTHILTRRMTWRSPGRNGGMEYFNSHPHEEDDSTGVPSWTCQPYFNSHPHEEDDVFRSCGRLRYYISTHILTRRMTVGKAGRSYGQGISTHILTRRMTRPRTHTHSLYRISTHILTRRMTAILNKNNPFKITYYINNKHFISIVDIFFHFHIYFQA